MFIHSAETSRKIRKPFLRTQHVRQGYEGRCPEGHQKGGRDNERLFQVRNGIVGNEMPLRQQELQKNNQAEKGDLILREDRIYNYNQNLNIT